MTNIHNQIDLNNSSSFAECKESALSITFSQKRGVLRIGIPQYTTKNKKRPPLSERPPADGPWRHKDAVFLVAKIVKTANLNHQPDPFNHQFVCL